MTREPKQENDWIEWAGGECPVEGGVLIEAELLNGTYYSDIGANLDWKHLEDGGDIIAYRVISQ